MSPSPLPSYSVPRFLYVRRFIFKNEMIVWFVINGLFGLLVMRRIRVTGNEIVRLRGMEVYLYVVLE